MFSRKSSVAVLGAGHGGMALAGYLAQQGHAVNLWSRSLARILPVDTLGGIRLSAPGSASALAPIAMATCSVSATLADAERIVVAVPAFAHADVARRCAPYLRNGQTVLILPGRTGGALEFRRTLRSAGCRARILLGEANTFPFAARSTGPTSATIHGTKTEVLAAALPAQRTPELLARWRPLLPMLAPAGSVLETGLANFGAILHPIITLLNARRIEKRETFNFYTDGVTPTVADALADADAERLAIASHYQVPALSLTDWIHEVYGHRADTIQEALCGNPAYASIKAPTTLDHRYLLEDVPTGLIPLIKLGEAAGLASPTMSSFVQLAEDRLGRERWQSPRSLQALGLAGMAVEDIRTFVECGPVPAKPAAVSSRLTMGPKLARLNWS